MPSKFAIKALAAAISVLAASCAFAVSALADTPDVTQDNPLNDGVGGISLQQSGSAWHLVFPSDIYVSSGTLQISGQRSDTSVFTMDAYQTGVSAPVGALEYSIAYGHDHWHYLALDRYDLLPHNPSVAGDGLADTLGRDQKSGFCLEDSTGWNGYNQTQCQHNNPSALSLTGVNSEVIGAGRHDLYTPNVDGQYIDITGVVASVPAGGSTQVELVQWVNADCRLADTTTSDNTWSIVLTISKNASGSPSVSMNSGTGTYWSQWYSGHPSQQCLPKDTVRPTLSGPASTNNVESAAPGSWLIRMATGFSSPFLYQWRRCDATGWNCDDTSKGNGNIPGATSANYVPTDADLGHTLRVRVTGQFPGTTEQQTPEDSAATSVVVVGQPPSTGTGGGTTTSNNQTGNNQGTQTIVALTAALKADTHFSVRSLLKHGVRARAHCSEACTVQLNLLGPGAINLAKGTGSIARAGSHTYTVRLTSRAKRIVKRYHGGTLMLWLHVKTKDGQQQTVSRVLHLTG
jgi:hypothetical protein